MKEGVDKFRFKKGQDSELADMVLENGGDYPKTAEEAIELAVIKGNTAAMQIYHKIKEAKEQREFRNKLLMGNNTDIANNDLFLGWMQENNFTPEAQQKIVMVSKLLASKGIAVNEIIEYVDTLLFTGKHLLNIQL
jgi:hypothetical protein